jgi:hypothetical protein
MLGGLAGATVLGDPAGPAGAVGVGPGMGALAQGLAFGCAQGLGFSQGFALVLGPLVVGLVFFCVPAGGAKALSLFVGVAGEGGRADSVPAVFE